MLNAILHRYGHFNQQVFDKLLEKCRRETRFGRLANVVVLALYHFTVRAKRARAFSQEAKRQVTEPVRALLGWRRSEELPPPKEQPLWERDLTVPNTWSYVQQRVTIIAELSIPQCKRYRVEQKVAALQAMGYVAEAVSFTDLEACTRLLPLSRMVIFYRTPFWKPVERLIKECARLKIPSVYDIDDLVFDTEEYAKHPVLKTLSPQESASLLSGAESYAKCLTACDHAIASTETLRTWMAKYSRGNVFVVENALDDVSLAAEQTAKPRNSQREVVTIGYGSGTKSHDHDFALAQTALERILAKYPQVRLALHGHLTLPELLKPYSARIFRIPFLAVPQYLQSVAALDVNLAPLESNVFNDAKSNIKFLEASALGVPTVASGSAEFRKVIDHGINGFVANSDDEWFSALEQLVTSADLRAKIGQQAKEFAFSHYRPQQTQDQLRQVLDGVLKPLPVKGAKPRLLLVNCLFKPVSFGGATLVVESIIPEMQANWDIAVCTTTASGDLPEYGILRYDVDQTHVFGIRPAKRMLDSAEHSDPNMGAAFASMLAAFRPDVVHFHSIQGFGGDIVKTAKAFGAKVAVTHHDAWWVCERQFLMMANHHSCFQKTIDLRICAGCTQRPDFTYRRFRELEEVLTAVDLNLAPSNYHAKVIEANLPQGVRVLCNKNGVQLPKTPPPQRVIDPRNIKIGYLGGGRAVHKGYFVLRDALKTIEQSNYTLVLTDIHRRFGGMTGIDLKDWPIKGVVNVVDPYEQDELDEFFQKVDVLVFPSQWHESFGMTVREAMARNVWVISTRSGGVVEEMVDGVNGDIVEIGDTGALRDKILRILQNPEQLKNYQTPGRDKIRGFPEQARELDGLLRDLLK